MRTLQKTHPHHTPFPMAAKTLTIHDLTKTLNHTAATAAETLAEINTVREARLAAISAGWKAAEEAGLAGVGSPLSTFLSHYIVQEAQNTAMDIRHGAKLEGLVRASLDIDGASGVSGGGKGPSAVNPAKVVSGIRLAAGESDMMNKLAFQDASQYNYTAARLNHALRHSPAAQNKFLDAYITTSKLEAGHLGENQRRALFTSFLTHNLLGDASTLRFNIVDSAPDTIV